jgi:hypothetical protein
VKKEPELTEIVYTFSLFKTSNEVMTNARKSMAPEGNATTSRRAGVRSGGLRRVTGRESWRRLFQRGRRNLRSAEGFIGMARQIIDVCETIVVEHPIRAVHEMQRVAGLLDEAAKRSDVSAIALPRRTAASPRHRERAGMLPRG